KSNIDVVLWRVLFNIHQTQEADVFNFDSCFLSDFALCAVFKGLHVFHMTTWPSPLPLTMGAFALAYEHLVTFQDHDPHTYSRPLFVLHCVFTFPLLSVLPLYFTGRSKEGRRCRASLPLRTQSHWEAIQSCRWRVVQCAGDDPKSKSVEPVGCQTRPV